MTSRRARLVRVVLVAVVGLLAALAGPLSSTRGSAQEVLTNDSVIGMVKAGLADSVIIQKSRASPQKFDTSTDGLIKLKHAGVPDNIVGAAPENWWACQVVAAASPSAATPIERESAMWIQSRALTAGLLMLAVAVSGCMPSLPMSYVKPAPDPATKGEIGLVVTDGRKAEERGLTVGVVRSMVGIPTDLTVQPDRHPTRVLQELLSDSLGAAGYRVNAAGRDVPEVHANLVEYWCDGYAHYSMTLIAPLELRGAEGTPTWTHTLDARSKVTLMWSARELDDGWKQLLDRAVQMLAGQFRSAQFRSAYQSAARR